LQKPDLTQWSIIEKSKTEFLQLGGRPSCQSNSNKKKGWHFCISRQSGRRSGGQSNPYPITLSSGGRSGRRSNGRSMRIFVDTLKR